MRRLRFASDRELFVGSVRQFRERHRAGWGVAAGLLALLVLVGAVFAFAMGTCHDAGGFCSEPFGQVHVESYATAAVLTALGVLVGATAVTLRLSMLMVVMAAGAIATTVLAIIGESLH